jgi:hypothetical protein
MGAPSGYRWIDCRAFGHSWRHRGLIGTDDTRDRYPRPFGAGTGMIGRISICAECKGHRVKWVTRSGEVVNRYYPPDGYSLKGETDRPTMRDWRTTWVASAFADFTMKGTA